MPPDKKMPTWDPNAKEESLELYASWLNQIARGAFLEAGYHQQMFFFVADVGEIQSCILRDGLPLKERDVVLKQEMEKIKPFGTIQVIVKEIVHPQFADHPKAHGVRFVGEDKSDTKETTQDCLLVRLLSRTGREIIWANPIIKKDGRLVLADAIVTYPKQ